MAVFFRPPDDSVRARRHKHESSNPPPDEHGEQQRSAVGPHCKGPEEQPALLSEIQRRRLSARFAARRGHFNERQGLQRRRSRHCGQRSRHGHRPGRYDLRRWQHRDEQWQQHVRTNHEGRAGRECRSNLVNAGPNGTVSAQPDGLRSRLQRHRGQSGRQ